VFDDFSFIYRILEFKDRRTRGLFTDTVPVVSGTPEILGRPLMLQPVG
jgi:hypothetical protein